LNTTENASPALQAVFGTDKSASSKEKKQSHNHQKQSQSLRTVQALRRPAVQAHLKFRLLKAKPHRANNHQPTLQVLLELQLPLEPLSALLLEPLLTVLLTLLPMVLMQLEMLQQL